MKVMFSAKIPKLINLNKITETQARKFISLVRQRAKGNIDSPMLETLLLFNTEYKERPEREFIDGYKYKYGNSGKGKAKGVAFSIEVPKTWLAKKGNRPNIVQNFISKNGHGFESLLILIKKIELPPGKTMTKSDVTEILNPKDIKTFLPNGYT